jgi:hypothetical protein
MSQFLTHVGDHLTRSAEHWHQLYSASQADERA